MTDLLAIANGIATRYAPAQLPATPTASRAIVSSSAQLPDQLGATPCVLVFPTGGALRQGTGHRAGLHKYAVRLYYDQSPGGELERDTEAIARWVSLLIDQLKSDSDLGGSAVIGRVVGWTIGALQYAGTRYSGGEVSIEVVTDEPFGVTP